MTRPYTPSAGRQCDVLRLLAAGHQAAAHNLILNSPGVDWHAALDGRYCPSLVPPHREAGGAVPGLSVARVKPAGIVARAALTSNPAKRKKAA
jgi:hypothetical protein